jgi:DNA-binding PadR family transcriptional regulator
MSLEHILLGMLREPATGYDLKAAFNEGARYFWSAELSQIYPALQLMQRNGWLTSRREPSPVGPQRRVYRRTAKGTAELRKWLQTGPVMGTERFAYIGQLIFMGDAADLETTARFLRQLRDRLFEFQRLLQAAEADLLGRPNAPDGLDDHAFHELLSVRIGVHSLQAKVAACDENLKLVRARIKKLRRDHRATNNKKASVRRQRSAFEP